MQSVTSDLTQSTRLILSDLESLKHEHNLLLSSSIDRNKIDELEENLQSIDLGIDEACLMLQLENYFENLNHENDKLFLQVQRLTQENNWLREELSLTEKHLQTSQQTQESYQRDINLLNESLSSMKTIDCNQDLSNEYSINPDPKTYSEIPARFRTLHNLVIQYAQAGRYEVAVPLCRQALDDLEKTHGHMHPDVATMLNILALVYRDQNKFHEALQLLQEALTIREQTLGLDHPAVAATLNNLAVLYGKKNRYKEAEPLCKRALEIREKYFGKDHPDVGKQLNNLALLCLNQGKYDQVEEYYRRAIEIYVKSFGKNDLNVLKTKNNLASAYLREGKYRYALDLYHEILLDGSWTTNHEIFLTIFKNLSGLCRRQGLYDQADFLDSCFNKSSDISKQVLEIVKQIGTFNDSQTSISHEYGKLRRSGSFQKLRQSIRRGSEKLVQKLRGTPANPLPSFNSMQFHQSESVIKRTSSLSVLNHQSPSFPLQQQQHQHEINRTFVPICSIDRHTKHQFIPPSRGRLISAENVH